MISTLLLSLLLACHAHGGAAGDDTAPPGASPTWNQDVAPILAKSCMGCHSQGGIAPIPLDSYTDAAAVAAQVADATLARRMPPFLVTGDGSCGDFADNPWLSDADLATLQAWAQAGAPEGPAAAPVTQTPMPTLSGDLRELHTPDFVPEIVGGAYAESDEYRCFDIGTVDQDTWLTGYDVQPGNAALIHHVLVMPVDPSVVNGTGKTAAQLMTELEAQDDREGWPCFGNAGQGLSYQGIPVAWAPGQGAVVYPDHSGVRLAAGTHMVAQVHYNLADEAVRGQSDQTTIQLQLQDKVDKEGFFALPDGFLDTLGGWNEASLPAGEVATTYSWHSSSADLLGWYAGDTTGIIGGDLYAIMPHMHTFGRQMQVHVDDTCIAQVDQWNFGWQRMYTYATPIHLTGAETLKVDCTYDTTAAEESVTPGWGTGNEMCLTVLYVVLDRG